MKGAGGVIFHMLETISGVGEIRDESGTLASVRYHMFLEGDVTPPATEESAWALRSGEFVVLSGRIPQEPPSRTYTLLPEEGQEFPLVIVSEDRVSGRYKVVRPASLDAAG